MEATAKHERPLNPRATANPLSAVTFSWIFDLFILGFRRDLEITDLYSPLEEHSSNFLGNKFERAWIEECARAAKKRKQPKLYKVIWRVIGPSFVLQGAILGCIELFVRVMQPLFLGSLIKYFTQQQLPPEEVDPAKRVTLEQAYFYAGGVVIASAISVMVQHPYMLAVLHIGMKIRVGLCSLIYRKSLRLSKTALGETTVGQMVNLISNDVNRYDICSIFVHYLWVGPLQTILILYFLWDAIGMASVVGITTLLIFVPLQAWLGKKSSLYRLRTAIKTDERVRLMNEIISGIQVIKMYTWEKPFANLVSASRRKEINEIRKTSYIRGFLLSYVIFHVRVAIFLSIFSYVIFGNYINAEKVFVVTSFFNLLRQTMTIFFPQGIGQVAEATVSTNRIQKFLMYDEIDRTSLAPQNAKEGTDVVNTNGIKLTSSPPPSDKLTANGNTRIGDSGGDSADSSVAVSLVNVNAKWTPELVENTLNDLTLDFPTGELSAVIGLVGSGKSSLFHCILQELPTLSGKITVSGCLSYASQEPWLFAGSVRQNILFGEPYDRDRYKEVTRVCALRPDFSQFPYGDRTIIGDRGTSLSGGQRARINLARAVYKKADVYLLDDPLSAVDTHVGRHLFDDCIVGYLKGKTRILITHQLQYLNNLDNIVMLENGNVLVKGTYREIQDSGKDFAKLLLHMDEGDAEDERIPTVKRQSSQQSVASSTDETRAQSEPPEVAEMRAVGTVGGYVYREYFAAAGSRCKIFFCFALCVLTQILASGGDYWVTFWVNLEERVSRMKLNSWQFEENMSPTNSSTNVSNNSTVSGTFVKPSHTTHNDTYVDDSRMMHSLVTNLWFELSRNDCAYIFAGLTITLVFVTLLRSFMFYRTCMSSSMNLHNNMFNSVTRATMRFFNTNSAGRILNRFSKDMGAIDDMLPGAMIDCLQIGLTLLGIITVVAIVNHLLLIPTFIIGILFYYIRTFYLATSRSVKRLEGVTRSPVFSHLSASLQGLTTIRAFKAQKILEQEFDTHQDLHSSAWFIFLATSRAFGYWLDMICVIYITLVTLSFLVFDNETFGGNVGLAITQSVGLTGMFQWGMRQSAELENQMTSVERVLEYSNLESEPALESPPDKKPPKSWPQEGKIVFSNIHLRYTPEEAPVLKNLNFTVNPGEKVGIVGRTGAGKSSLVSSMFRFAHLTGEILIDDVATSGLGLHDIRSKISIIPQEPVLFSGTMRKNLDPFDEFNDDVLWNALEEVDLKEVVADMPGGLNSKMSEGGSNFSVGQRQLVCLARAIVRNNKILILDEATANVDPQTDALLQQTIRRKFANCTMLTIAHRLNTVMDSDKVLVMNAGTIVEYDHPHVLLRNKDGFLYGLVEQTGKTTAETLHNIAAANYRKYIDDDTPSVTDF